MSTVETWYLRINLSWEILHLSLSVSVESMIHFNNFQEANLCLNLVADKYYLFCNFMHSSSCKMKLLKQIHNIYLLDVVCHKVIMKQDLQTKPSISTLQKHGQRLKETK